MDRNLANGALASLGAIGVMAFGAWVVPGLTVWAVVLLVVALALPVAMLGATIGALRRGHWLLLLTKGGVIRHILSGGPLRLLLHAGIGLGLALVALMRLVVMDLSDILALVAGMAAFLLMLRSGLVQGWLVAEAGAVYAVRAARRAGAVATMLAAFGLLLILPPETRPPGLAVLYPVGAQTALVGEVLRLALLGKELEAFLLGLVPEGGFWARFAALLYIAAGLFSVAWVVFSAAGLAVLPGRDLARAVAPASVAPVSPGRWAVRGAVLGGGMVVLVLMLAAFRLEARLASVPTETRPMAVVARLFATVTAAEEINGRLHAAGTMDAIRAVEEEEPLPVMVSPEAARAQLERLAGAGFDLMLANVDGYLDHYYSLRGEYARLAALPLGRLEEKLQADLTEALDKGDPLGPLHSQLASLAAEDAGLRVAFEGVQARRAERVQTILDQSQLDPGKVPPGTILDVTGVFVLAPPELPALRTEVFLTDLSRRMQGGAVAGTVVAALIVRRIVGKGVMRVAAKAAGKAVAARGAGSLGGAGAGGAAGAAIGSLVPVVGTVIGGVVGAVVGGVATWVATDLALLKLEEYFTRDTFRAEIVAAIEDQRAAVLAQIRAAGAVSDPSLSLPAAAASPP